jgi:putative membrane protein
MNMDVKNVAMKQSVSLPSDISIREKASYQMLSGKNGADFDKAYIEDMIKDHQADIEAFQKEINSGQDAEAKAVAEKALPIIREHLRLAQQVAKEIGMQ